MNRIYYKLSKFLSSARVIVYSKVNSPNIFEYYIIQIIFGKDCAKKQMKLRNSEGCAAG